VIDRHWFVERSSLGFADQQQQQCGEENTRRCHYEEGNAPTESRRDPATDCGSRADPDCRTKREEGHRPRAAFAREQVGNQRIGWRNPARFTDRDPHPCRRQRHEIGGQPTCCGKSAPHGASGRNDPCPVGSVGEPGNRHPESRIEKREHETGEQTELAVRQVQFLLDRFG